MGFRIRWLGTACFEIKLDQGKTILIDPYLDDSVSAPIGSDQIEGCDAILITHGHYDHILDVGKMVQRFRPSIFCSREVADALIEHQNVDAEQFTAITAGDTDDDGQMDSWRDKGLVVENRALGVELDAAVHLHFLEDHIDVALEFGYLHANRRLQQALRPRRSRPSNQQCPRPSFRSAPTRVG